MKLCKKFVLAFKITKNIYFKKNFSSNDEFGKRLKVEMNFHLSPPIPFFLDPG